jgi:type IV pilus assembly protein PilP
MSRRRGIMLVTVALTSGWASAQTVPSPRAEELSRAVEPAASAPYDPIGRRDPFRPPRAGSQTPLGEPRTPLQRYEIGQLRLVAIIYETRDPRAVVEDDQGLGYIVRVGTPIGPNGGEVRAIERGRVIVEESSVDFYGERQPNEVTLELRTADRGKR